VRGESKNSNDSEIFGAAYDGRMKHRESPRSEHLGDGRGFLAVSGT